MSKHADHAVKILLQAGELDGMAMRLRADAGKILAYCTPPEVGEVAKKTGISTGTLELLKTNQRGTRK